MHSASIRGVVQLGLQVGPCRPHEVLFINAGSYAWNFFEGDIINETNPVHYYNTMGVNSVKIGVKLTVTSPGGCLDSLLLDGIITVVNIVTGIESNKAATFSYYPNPVKEKLFLESDEIIKTVKF